MPKAKQLSLSVENRPGTLAHVARILGDAKVNILAFLATTSAAEIPDNVNKAKKGFGRCGVPLHGGEVLHVELPNVPGALGNFAGKLAAKDINVSSGWQTTATGSKKASVTLDVSDLEKQLAFASEHSVVSVSMKFPNRFQGDSGDAPSSE